jgi:hypothetical protein
MPVVSKQAVRWVGWQRRDSSDVWRPVIGGTSEDEVFNRLLDRRLPGDKVILPMGRNPNSEVEAC